MKVVAFSCSSTKANFGAIDGNEHMQLALFSAHIGNVDVEVADRVALELLLRRPVAVDIRQAADAVTLHAQCSAFCDCSDLLPEWLRQDFARKILRGDRPKKSIDCQRSN